ncbi:MAG: hypothetical protein HY785_24685 [Oscillatoriophycideae cyanobacterium NC_groundwater_1537_Pr4_S-0.65um_50_18]|nr:hypothetical protein [Oscillatoriophycideae cyanobacterium NC_groundwater_1537_Pr4_S-0.65um_50_18]
MSFQCYLIHEAVDRKTLICDQRLREELPTIRPAAPNPQTPDSQTTDFQTTER